MSDRNVMDWIDIGSIIILVGIMVYTGIGVYRELLDERRAQLENPEELD